MKEIEHIEIYYTDSSMEKITLDQELFLPLVQEIRMTKNLFEDADYITKAYLDRIKEVSKNAEK